jgi:hypothetical protein
MAADVSEFRYVYVTCMAHVSHMFGWGLPMHMEARGCCGVASLAISQRESAKSRARPSSWLACPAWGVLRLQLLRAGILGRPPYPASFYVTRGDPNSSLLTCTTSETGQNKTGRARPVHTPVWWVFEKGGFREPRCWHHVSGY